MLDVEVAYATSAEQVVVPVSLPEGSTVADAVQVSGVLQRFPEIDAADLNLGIFAVPCEPMRPLKSGDRVEIYRSLLCDPKEARRKRAIRS